MCVHTRVWLSELFRAKSFIFLIRFLCFDNLNFIFRCFFFLILFYFILFSMSAESVDVT